MQDLRYAFRMLVKNPGFTAVAILALALGIGANTAIFTLVNAVLLRPLPYPDSERIVFLERKFREGGSTSVSLPKCDYWRRNARSFEAVASADFLGGGYNMAGEEPERLKGVRVTSPFFQVMGIRPALGRAFTSEDDRPNTGRTLLLSHGLWQRRFGGDRGVLGRVLVLNNEPATVIGVMPASFRPWPDAEIWLPLQPAISYTDKANYLACMARLAPGTGYDRAATELAAIAGQMRKEYPDLMGNESESARLRGMREVLLGDVRPALLVVMATVAAVLLIACANVANLLLARAAGRTREVAIRMAVGASRWRLMRQLLTESVLLSLGGGALGLVLGVWSLRLLERVAPAELPLVEPSLDLRVLVFTLGVAVLTGLLFGLVPALHASSPKLSETLKEGSRGSSVGFRKTRTRAALVIAEIGLALVVVICAALMTETFVRLRSVNAGFDPNGVVTMQMSLSGPRFETPEQLDGFFRQTLQRIEAIPGVQAVGVAPNLPLELGPDMPFQIEGERDLPHHEAQWRYVTPGYFRALGVPVRRGRAYADTDTGTSQPVIIVNEALTRRYFKNEDPIGHRITIGRAVGGDFRDPTRMIVGVVGDVKHTSLAEEAPPTI
jgi:predicted permease